MIAITIQLQLDNVKKFNYCYSDNFLLSFLKKLNNEKKNKSLTRPDENE